MAKSTNIFEADKEMKKTKKEIKPIKTYTTGITFTCPVRGEITQIVEVKRYKGSDTYYPLFLSEEVGALLNQEELPLEDEF